MFPAPMKILLTRRTCDIKNLPTELCDMICEYVFISFTDAIQCIRDKKKKIHNILVNAHTRRNGFGYDAENGDEDEHWSFAISDTDDNIVYKTSRVRKEWSQSIDSGHAVWFTMHGWNCTVCGNFLPHMYTSFVPPTPTARSLCFCV